MSDLVDCSAALVAANAEIASLKAAMEGKVIIDRELIERLADYGARMRVAEPHMVERLEQALQQSTPAPFMYAYGYRPNCSECAGVGCSDCILVMQLCEDCPPIGYPTNKTRCTPCPRRTPTQAVSSEGKGNG
jgi:hypothetical protein